MQEKLQECAAQEEQAGGEADRVETVILLVRSQLQSEPGSWVMRYIFGSPTEGHVPCTVYYTSMVVRTCKNKCPYSSRSQLFALGVFRFLARLFFRHPPLVGM